MLVPAEDGHFISEKFARISEIINEFDSRLRLVWIPPENRSVHDIKPFGIIHTAPDGLEKFVMLIKEDELDERVLQRLFLADTSKQDVLAHLEAREIAEALVANKEKMEKAEMRKDFIKTVVGSHKHSFKHNGRIIPT